MIPLIIGVILLVIIVYVALKIVKNILIAAVLIGAVFVTSFLIFGQWPDLQGVPIIGRFIPKMPSTLGDAIAVIKNVFYSLDIVSVNRDSNNNLLIVMHNSGKLEITGIEVFVDEEQAAILNNRNNLKSGDVFVFQIDWNQDFDDIEVKSDQISSLYSE